MGKIQVIFYSTSDGTEPVRDFLDSLDEKMRAKMVRTIALLRENGGEIREPESKYIGDGIFELRAKVGNNISRVLYFFFIGNKAILTNGFIKKTQNTPSREITRAKQYRNDFMSREGKNDD